MSTATDIVKTVEDQVLATVKAGQEIVVDAVRSIAGSLEQVIPDLSSVPYLDQLPKPAAAADAAFGFAEKLLTSQREFVAELLAAVPEYRQAAAKPAASTSAKASKAASAATN
jgi:hypothetical protein